LHVLIFHTNMRFCAFRWGDWRFVRNLHFRGCGANDGGLSARIIPKMGFGGYE